MPNIVIIKFRWTSKSEFYFRECPNHHTRGTQLPLACYSELTASGYEQPIPADVTTEYTSLAQKTLQENYGYYEISTWVTWCSARFLELFGFGNIETDEIFSVLYELYQPNSYYCIHMPSHIWNSNVCFNQPVVVVGLSILSFNFLLPLFWFQNHHFYTINIFRFIINYTLFFI